MPERAVYARAVLLPRRQNAATIILNMHKDNAGAWRLHRALKPRSHQIGILTAFPQRPKTLQIAEVRAVQSPATLCARFVSAVCARAL